MTSQPESNIAQRRVKRRMQASEKGNVRWQSILEAAARIFHDLGYERATLDDIAQAVGVKRASLYYYVGTKGELLSAILAPALRELMVELGRVVDPRDSAARQLEAAIAAHMGILAKHYPGLMVLLNESSLIDDPELHDIIQSNSTEHRVMLSEIIRRGVMSGEFREGIDPSVTALGILGMCNDTRHWWRPGRKSLTEVGVIFADLLVASVVRTDHKT